MLTTELESRDNSADKPSTAPSDTTCSSSDMATTPSAGHIEIETVESVDYDIDLETPDEHNTAVKPEENDELPTSADESELDPLQSNMSKADNDKETASQNACLEMGDEECWSKDFDRDSQSPNTRKKGWDVRCFVIGFLVLLLVVGASLVIVVAYRFKGETVYDFHFATYYGDHMVLQRAPHKAVIWGYGPIITDNTSVFVVMKGPGLREEYRTVVEKTHSGQVWRVMVGPVLNRGPFDIIASLEDVKDYEIQLKDVLFGDVWVCVDQNKMHLSVSKLMNGSEEGSAASNHYQDIRIFSLFPAKSDMLWYDLRGIQLHWTVPKSVVDERISQSHSNLHFPGVCWLFGKQLHDHLQYPIGLVSVTYSESIIEEWVPPIVSDLCKMPYTDSSSRIYNGMIHPMLDMQVYGLIWHQGDQDAREGFTSYNCALVEFIKQWRQEVYNRAGGSKDILLPVGIIQLPPKSTSSQYSYSYSDIRWKQTANFGYLPNPEMPVTFLAVTIDLPESSSNHSSLHGGHKHDIVSRLVHGALSIAYNQVHVVHQGPFPATYSASKDSITLTFDPPNISIRNSNGFEICCSNNRSNFCPTRNGNGANEQEWLSAPISDLKSMTSVTLTTANCREHVVGLRYAWREAPCLFKGCAIYGKNNFPMPPYIRFNLTDDGLTHVLARDAVDIL